jgi:hypothetical protein
LYVKTRQLYCLHIVPMHNQVDGNVLPITQSDQQDEDEDEDRISFRTQDSGTDNASDESERHGLIR